MMQLNRQQEQALNHINQWFNGRHKPIFKLYGYAGTGKTTLAKTIAANMNCDVMFLAPTNKAAHVLQRKGCPNASTVHAAIYSVKKSGSTSAKEEIININKQLEKTKNDFAIKKLQRRRDDLLKIIKSMSFSLNQDADIRKYGLIVLDECSMINQSMLDDILSFRTPVLAMGDPWQLPPVFGADFFTSTKPNYMLTDIQRQARDNPIINLATQVREGQHLKLGTYGNSKVIKKSDIAPGELLSQDQILVGKNKTKDALNSKIRAKKGYDNMLQPGEKIICLENLSKDKGLCNGSTWIVNHYDATNNHMDIISDDASKTRLDMVPANENKLGDTPLNGYDYGYAITVHKSQGSQWDNVAILDESSIFGKNSARWLYTGVTRAAERVTVIS